MDEYVLNYDNKIKKQVNAIKKLGTEYVSSFENAISKILNNPSANKKLDGNMKNLNCARFHKDYRIVYEIDAKEKVVILVFIGHRKDIYENLNRKL